ncbi:MAG: carboxypeptidase-like regulatory domain-containing protein [Candidatus Hydrogenedentales bacterium]
MHKKILLSLFCAVILLALPLAGQEEGLSFIRKVDFVSSNQLRVEINLDGTPNTINSLQSLGFQEYFPKDWVYTGRFEEGYGGEDISKKDEKSANFNGKKPGQLDCYWIQIPLFPVTIRYYLDVPDFENAETIRGDLIWFTEFQNGSQSTPETRVPTYEESETSSLSGIVRKEDSLTTIRDATLTLTPGNYTVQSGFGGSFRFNAIPYGHYELTTTRAGYHPSVREITIPTDLLIQIELTPVEDEGETPIEGEVPEEGEESVEGEGEETSDEGEEAVEGEGETPDEGEEFVEGEGGTPDEGEEAVEGEGETEVGSLNGIVRKEESIITIRDATLTLNPGDYTVQSGLGGSFRFNAIPYGSYELTTTKTGYHPAVQEITIPTDLLIQIELTPVEDEGETEGEEGESAIEGEPQVEGETPHEGEVQSEGETPIEGEESVEGEVSVEGEAPTEGEAPAEGEASNEGENEGGEGDDDGGFCCNGSENKALDLPRFWGDFFLLGMTMLVLMRMGRS